MLNLKVTVGGRHETPDIRSARTPLPDLSESEGRVDPSEACGRIHTLLERLPPLSAVEEVPFGDRLYFFYEEGEPSAHGTGGRVVRVGNHPKADHRLKGRLQDHYNDRGRLDAKNWSVFRRYLGGALLRLENPSSLCLAPSPGRGHWERQGQLSCSACAAYERRVSDLLREKFRFRCVRVDDRDERNGLEARHVATIAACNKCGPSEEWLGRFCYSEIVRRSGLWNRHYVGKAPMMGQDSERFQELVQATPGAEVAGLSTTLLLIPCSAGKRGAPDPGLPVMSVLDFLGPEARSQLEQGRREAFGRPGVLLDEHSPMRPAIAYYTGQPYKTSEFRDLLIEGLRMGLHCLIISGGYGLLRPEEPIHSYNAHLPTQTRSVWGRRIPTVLRDYVSRNGIQRVLGVYSAGYAVVVPHGLAAEDRREVPRFDPLTDTGNAQTAVPTKVGSALLTLMRAELHRAP